MKTDEESFQMEGTQPLKVSDLRHYGAAFSDAESAWPADVKKRMRKKGRAVMAANMGPLERIRFLFAFLRARRETRKLDLTDLKAKGMNNDAFLKQQLEYLAAFAALAKTLGSERAVEVMNEVMDKTAREPLLFCLPNPENVKRVGPDPFNVFREYLGVAPDAAKRAGCNEISIAEDSEDAFQFNVTWCIWLELAERMGLPEACRPNCYADDLVFPDYFAGFGIEYKRSQTLACGGSCCDFRFERKAQASGPE